MERDPARQHVLVALLAGVVIGGATGFVSGRVSVPIEPLAPAASASSGAASPSASAAAQPDAGRKWPGHRSYAQQGEDLVVAELLNQELHVAKPSYIDIGAHDPVVNSNTYLFYTHGGRGVLVEPNPFFANKLRTERPEDHVVEAGIGPNVDDTMADYYVVGGDGQRNTFSKDEADEITRVFGPAAIVGKTQIKLVNVNKVLAEYFPTGVIDFLSVDTEGLDLAILKSLDFSRFRPKVVCAETSEITGGVRSAITDLMKSKDYGVRGGSFVNTIYVDNRLWKFHEGAKDAAVKP